jgi:predicted GNAT superfamily acetyltransferase
MARAVLLKFDRAKGGTKMKTNLRVRQLQTIDELKKVQQLESKVWKMDPIPIHQTLTAVKNGGIILGAFKEEEIVAFSYGFPGFRNGMTYLCSHMLGVDPGYQKLGIGYLLKKKQREIALEMGYQLITWTYDPLESLNGYLNLLKLGGIVGEYIENQYGMMNDSLNYGLPTDRFLVEWWIDSAHVGEKRNLKSEVVSPAIKWTLNETGVPVLKDFNPTDFQHKLHTAEEIYLPIPSYFQQMKQANLDLAIDWRLKTREIFQLLLNEGRTATQLIRDEENPVSYYRFVKRSTLAIQ